MIKESFLMVDALAQKENIFTRVDTRIKLALALLTVIAVITLPGLKFQWLVFAASMIGLKVIKTPWRIMAARIFPPVALSTVIVGLDTFLVGGKTLFSLHIGSMLITAHSDGLYMGLVLAARLLGSISAIMLLSLTAPLNEIMNAAAWFRVPKILVEIAMLTYRYLYVLWDEGSRIRQAQMLRLGYPAVSRLSQWKRTMKSTSTLMGMVLIRAYDRAESAYDAMQVRGYRGEVLVGLSNNWSREQLKYIIYGSAILLLMGVLSFS